MKLELRAEVDESLVAECLERAIRDHGAHLLQVLHKLPQPGILIVDWSPRLQVLLGLEHLEHSLLHTELVAQVRLHLALPVVTRGLGSVDLVIQQRHLLTISISDDDLSSSLG